jgi:hypothetical protein
LAEGVGCARTQELPFPNEVQQKTEIEKRLSPTPG